MLERDKCVHRIMSLCKEKGYRLETWLIGANILDRFLHQVDSRTLSIENKQA
jgi:hypothetical protein